MWLAQIGNNKNRRGLEWISGPKGLQAEFCRMKKLEGGNICEDSSVEAGIEAHMQGLKGGGQGRETSAGPCGEGVRKVGPGKHDIFWTMFELELRIVQECI